MARWRKLAIGLGALCACAGAWGCQGRILGEAPVDFGWPEDDASRPPVARDAGAQARDAGSPPFVPGQDAGGAPDAGPPDGGPIDPSSPPLAREVELVGIAAFQGVRVALAQEGVPVASRSSPLVADRDVLIRLYVRPGSSSPRTLRGEVIVSDGKRVLGVHVAEATVRGPTQDEQPQSALDVRIPAAQVTTETRIAARLVDPAGELPMGMHPARLPRDGSSMPLGAQSDAGGLELVIVPVSWEADGSSRLPDTSERQLDRIRDLLLAVYPIAHLRLRVREPVPFRGGMLWGDVDFGSLNDQLMDVRARDRAPAHAYYYGLVRPTESFSSYCGGGCTLGMSYVADSPRDEWMRVGSGIGFGDAISAWTLAHEVGHQYGRYHAPCGVRDPDPYYPHRGGSIGVWGWDARSGRFFDPRETADFMSYCDPEWISDYTWNAMFERTIAVRRLAAYAHGVVEPLRRLRVRPEGAVWGGTLSMLLPHARERAVVVWIDAYGAEIGRTEAPAVALSHSEERVVFLRMPPSGTRAVRVIVAGMDHTVTW